MGTLDDEGYIQGGQASFMPDAWGFDGSMFIDLTLTEFGEKNKDDIISMVFNYLNVMSENGVTLAHFNELKATNNIAYDNYTTLPPLQAALSLTNRIFELEPLHLIEYEYVTEDFDAQLILNVLNQMKPENKIIRSKVHFNLPEDQKGGLMQMKRSGDFSQDSVSVHSASNKVTENDEIERNGNRGRHQGLDPDP